LRASVVASSVLVASVASVIREPPFWSRGHARP
jgi:hypothetical protein